MSIFRRLLAAERGTIMVMAAFALTAVMGMSGLAVEVGNGYSTKVRNQRVADMAALGAAQAFQSSQSTATATQVAKDIVAASGLPASSATVTAPVTINGTNAIQVTVTTAVPVRLAQVVMNNTSYNVTNSAAASLSATSGCMAALSSAGTYGITLTGGAKLTATGCGLQTNSGISVSAGATITAKQVTAGKAISDQAAQWGTPGITTTPTANNIQQNKGTAATDTIGSDSRVIAGFAKLGIFTVPTAPANGAQAWNFDWSHSGAVAAWWNGSTGTYTVPSNSVPYNVTSITVAGGIKVVVQDGAMIRTTGGMSVSGNVTMGAVTLDVGGSIVLTGGVRMSVASGPVYIGNDGAGNAINVGGGSPLSFGNGFFSANGSIVTSGGSTIVFGATTSHFINGTLSLNGNSTFGAGGYYINGGFTNNTGGTMTGSDVTFFMSGSLTLSGGTSMNLSAPTSDAGGGITDLLFATKTTSQTKIGGGSQNVYAGLVYAPNSNMVMDGGAGATGGGRCFGLAVGTLTMNGGTATGITCTGFGMGAGTGGGGGGVSLLQ